MSGTAKVFGVVAGVAALAVTAMLVLPKTLGHAGITSPPATPDGGGWAHAGAVPPGVQLPSPSSGGLGAKALLRPQAVGSTVADFPVAGVDASSHDHSTFPVNWNAVAAASAGSGQKTAFAYIKATEGSTYTNPYFATDFQAARDAGLMAGAYAFARPDNPDAKGQADYLVNNGLWQADTRTLIPMLDLEWPYSTLKLPACWGLSTTDMVSWIRAFVTEVEARTGRQPMIYTNANWWNPCTGNDTSFGDYPLDIAAYGTTPPTTLPAGWSRYTLWQYAAGANNVANDLDRDVYNGDLNSLATLGGATPPTAISLRSHANNLFVTAESAGAKPLVANRTSPGQWETFDVVNLDSGYVGLRAHANGQYVTADAGGAQPLVASRLSASTWEKFQIVQNADGSVSLKAAVNGRYVTAESGGAAPLIANRTGIGPWEEFDELTKPTTVQLKARVNGYWVTAEAAGTKPLIANRTAAGAWETFDMYTLPGNWVAILAHVDSRWVTADVAGTMPLIANRPSIGAWEQFRVTHNPDGSVSLLSSINGKYVTAENAGASPLIANRPAAGAWEEFDLVPVK